MTQKFRAVNTPSYRYRDMIIGERVLERMRAADLSQAELARRVGVAQPTIFKLIHSSKKGSAHLHKIARELGTTPAYLSGETDDPAPDALPPVRHVSPPTILLPVMLPPEYALADMFRGLMASMPDVTGDELALELAKLLPIALGRLKGPFRYEGTDAGGAGNGSPEAPADVPPQRRRA